MWGRYFIQKKYLILGMSFLVLWIFYTAAVDVIAQDISVDNLANRLQQCGVKVKKIDITSRVPLNLGIVIQGSSGDKNSTIDDVWAELLAVHEAKLVSRVGLPVDSLTLHLLNNNGEEISTNQYLVQDENGKAATVSAFPSQLNDIQAEHIASSRLAFGEIQLSLLTVTSDNVIGNNSQILTVIGVVPDIDAANRSVGPFIDSLRSLMWGNNADKSIAITMCRAHVNNKKGDVVVDYLIDVETGAEMFRATPRLRSDFHL